MKNLKLKFTVLLLMAASLSFAPKVSLAATDGLPAALLERNSPVYQLDRTTSVAVTSEGVYLINLNQNGASKKLGQQQTLDVHVLNNPAKVVVLTAGPTNQLEKHVYNADGLELSITKFPLKAPAQGKVKWVAPAAAAKERIMVQEGNQFTLYSNAGKPIAKYTAQAEDLKDMYMGVGVVDWDFTAYPNLAIKYSGERIMAWDYFVRIVNLYSKTVTSIPRLEIDQQLQINSQGQLNVWSSYSFEGITPPSAVQPDQVAAQSFHALYSLSNGKPLVDHQREFEQLSGETPGGWNTQVVGSTVFVQDLATEQWSLYPVSSPAAIARDLTGVAKGSKFLGFDSSSGTAFFMTAAEGSAPTFNKVKVK